MLLVGRPRGFVLELDAGSACGFWSSLLARRALHVRCPAPVPTCRSGPAPNPPHESQRCRALETSSPVSGQRYRERQV
ncbi:hypothetical protein J1605_006102 [Eschrichtius robustus]|uniref:Secreted protein n=1 Tax=Eschrichtius robustus TaxID=9764 RepID=A0AB34H5D6_ESCRO|nr:hypothetical protein J1605_006102 [Eschrichtius robustus]